MVEGSIIRAQRSISGRSSSRRIKLQSQIRDTKRIPSEIDKSNRVIVATILPPRDHQKGGIRGVKRSRVSSEGGEVDDSNARSVEQFRVIVSDCFDTDQVDEKLIGRKEFGKYFCFVSEIRGTRRIAKISEIDLNAGTLASRDHSKGRTRRVERSKVSTEGGGIDDSNTRDEGYFEAATVREHEVEENVIENKLENNSVSFSKSRVTR